MKNEIDWSKAPEGATHYAPKRQCRAVFWRAEAGRGVEAWSINDDGSLQHYERPTWIEFDMSRLIPRPAAWNGQGLPPVGTVCEVSNCGNPFEICTIRYMGPELCVADHTMPHRDQHYHLSSVKFRPLRTPEQIAAEERELACYQMLVIGGKDPDSLDRDGRAWGQAFKLYDAGYRKQVKP